MDESVVQAWFKDVAVKLLDIAHTDAKPRFARNLEELKQGSKRFEMDGWTLVLDDPKGRVILSQDGREFDVPEYGFWIVRKVSQTDWAAEDAAYAGAKVVMWKVLSKAKKEKEEQEGTMRFFRPETVNYQKAGSTIDHYFGVYCSFAVADNAELEIEYDAADWSA